MPNSDSLKILTLPVKKWGNVFVGIHRWTWGLDPLMMWEQTQRQATATGPGARSRYDLGREMHDGGG